MSGYQQMSAHGDEERMRTNSSACVQKESWNATAINANECTKVNATRNACANKAKLSRYQHPLQQQHTRNMRRAIRSDDAVRLYGPKVSMPTPISPKVRAGAILSFEKMSEGGREACERPERAARRQPSGGCGGSSCAQRPEGLGGAAGCRVMTCAW